jgi:hypothetical protein
MNAIDLLESQHREVEDLFFDLERAPDAETKAELFEAVADKLAIHAAVEEHHFYPAVKDLRTEGLLFEAEQEHLAVKRLLAELLETDVEDETFDGRVKVLKETVERHVAEERSELFRRVRMLFTVDRLEAIGLAMSAEQDELEGRGAPREMAASETEDAAFI